MPSSRSAAPWILIALTGAAALPLGGCQDASARLGAGAPRESRPPVQVQLATAARRDVSRWISLPVELFPWQRTDVVAKVTGYVQKVLVDRGSVVKKDDVLATVWCPELSVQLSHEEAEEKAAEKELGALAAKKDLHKLIADRYTALIPDRAATQNQADIENATYAVTAAEVERAEATVVAKQERVHHTQTLLEYTTVRAPFDGVVSDRLIHEGAYVEMEKGTILFHMVQSNVLRATIDVPEANSPFVSAGTRVSVQFSELGPEWTELTVARSAQELDVRTRTLRVEADLKNPAGRFQPGMYGQSKVTLERHSGVVTVPSDAILKEGGDSVLTVQNGAATRVPVTLGISDGTFVEVVSGLDAGRSVVSPVRGVPEGAEVRAREEKAAAR
jgi:RND family efflux transporter MFP subunit